MSESLHTRFVDALMRRTLITSRSFDEKRDAWTWIDTYRYEARPPFSIANVLPRKVEPAAGADWALSMHVLIVNGLDPSWVNCEPVDKEWRLIEATVALEMGEPLTAVAGILNGGTEPCVQTCHQSTSEPERFTDRGGQVRTTPCCPIVGAAHGRIGRRLHPPERLLRNGSRSRA